MPSMMRPARAPSFVSDPTPRLGPRRRVVILGGMGWAVRNFLRNPGLRGFCEAHDVHFWSVGWEALRADEQVAGLAEVEPLTRIEPRGVRRRLDELMRMQHVARQNRINFRSKLFRQGPTSSLPPFEQVYRSALRYGALATSRVLPDALCEKVARWCGSGSPRLMDEYRDRLRVLGAELVVSTCPQTNLTEWPPIMAARALGIPVAVQLLSWDNIVNKGYFAADFDRYLVWSRLMADELVRIRHVPRERIVETGSPNFDFYSQPEFDESRAAFAARYGFDPARPILLYAGTPAGLMPHDPEVCGLIVEAIRSGALPKDLQVLARAHPKDGGDRWTALQQQLPELRVSIPNQRGDVAAWIPDDTSVRDLVSSVRHADVHVNAASTMSIDACVVNRPVVNVAFDPVDAYRSTLIGQYYRLAHYRPVVEMNAAVVARSMAELVAAVREALERPELRREGRAALVDLQIGRADGRAATRAGEALEAMLAAS